MLHDGQIVAFHFPQTTLAQGKLRPSLLIARLPGAYDDWLACMISSQVKQLIPSLDELISPKDPDFKISGRSTTSVIRASRLAVVSGTVFVGHLGEISKERQIQIRQHLIDWLRNP